MPNWIFPIKDSKHKARNPISDEFFDSPELLTDVSSLIRESIQNSIDAKDDPENPVKVRIRVANSPASSVKGYFGNLQPHLDSAFLEHAPKTEKVCRYLVIEDFNTTGLTGDSSLDTAPEGKEAESSYTYFVHVEGESNKGAGKKGKWGVGKVVFQMLSEIKTFYVYTKRKIENAPDSNTELFIGQSIIKFHKIDGITYAADGWYAEDNANGPYLPFSGESAKEMAAGWNVSRGDEPGLSIVIPFISDHVEIDAIRDAIIREYFIPIIKGDLVCELSGEGTESITLDKIGLLDYLRRITLAKNVLNDRSANEIGQAIELVEASEANIVDDFTVTIPDTLVSISHLELEETLVTGIRESFESGNKVRVKVWLSAPTGKPNDFVRDSFDVLISKSDVAKSATFYAREGILVPGSRPSSIANCVSLALVDSGPLADLLGAAEGPAHANWSAETQKFKRTYGNSTRAIRLLTFVRGTAEKIVQLISSQSGSFDSQVLSEFFKMPSENGSVTPPDKNIDVVVPPVPPTPAKRLDANVSAIQGGFKVSAPDLPNRNGILKIRVAYEVSRGNAFKKYNPLDFRFDFASFDLTNCTVLKQELNEIQLEVNDKAFSLSCSELGTIRDIEVDVDFQSRLKAKSNA
jgi:hypothetical protein